MRSCRFSHCKVQNGSSCGTCVQFVTDYMISPCASWACLGAAAPHHYDLNQMLVNFSLWLWLTLRAWSASGSSLSSASSTAQRLRHQLAPARCFKVVPSSISTATENAGPRAPAQSLTSARAPAPITSADSRVHFPLAVPAQQREIALSRSQDQILAASGSSRMEVIRSYLAAAIRNDTNLCGVPLGRCRQ